MKGEVSIIANVSISCAAVAKGAKATSFANLLYIVLKRATINLDPEVDVHNFNFIKLFIASFLKFSSLYFFQKV